MALPTVIAKNQTVSPIFLPRLGLSVPASPASITLSEDYTFFEISSEAVLESEVSSGNIVINDGVSDLSTAEALAYLESTGNFNGPVSSISDGSLLVLDGTTGRYSRATGISVDGSNNITGAGNYNGVSVGPRHYDAVVASSGGDYTLPSAAFTAGAKSVFVRSGTYVETANIVIPDGGHLIGEDGDVTIDLSGGYSIVIDGNGGVAETAGTISFTNGSAAVVGSGTTFTNLSPGDYISLGVSFYEIDTITDAQNLTITQLYTGGGGSGESYLASAMFKHIFVENIQIRGSTGTGITIRGCLESYLKDLVVDDCATNMTVSYCGDVTIDSVTSCHATGDGIEVTDSRLIQIINSHFRNCTENGVNIGSGCLSVKVQSSSMNGNRFRGGQVIGDATDVTFANCTASYNQDEGLDNQSTTFRVVIDSCIIFKNADDGIDFDAQDSTIVGCQIGLNGNNGIQGGQNGTIIGNRIFSNGAIGINLTSGDDDNSIVGNTIVGNTGTGLVCADSDNCLLSNNHVYDNGGAGIQVSGTSTNVTVVGNRSEGNTGVDYSLTASGIRFGVQTPGAASQGEILYNDGSGVETGWASLSPGTTGQFLQTLGPSANPQWATVPPPACTTVSATNAITTSSTTHVLATGMSITPASGNYLVIWTATVSHASGGGQVWMQVYAGGAAQNVEQGWQRVGGFVGDYFGSLTAIAKVTVNGSQAIQGRWRTTSGTGEMEQRSLAIVKVT